MHCTVLVFAQLQYLCRSEVLIRFESANNFTSHNMVYLLLKMGKVVLFSTAKNNVYAHITESSSDDDDDDDDDDDYDTCTELKKLLFDHCHLGWFGRMQCT